jgi:CBS domain-containing protein
MVETVRELLVAKGGAVWTVPPKASVYEAIALMASKEIGALVVKDGARVVGILSERDYAREVILKNKSSKTTSVDEIMTEKVIYVSPERRIEECMALMTKYRVRHLPVMDENSLVGMISIGDVLKEVIAGKEFLIEQLTDYLSGSY